MQSISERIERDFSYHPPKPQRIPDFSRIREEAKCLACTIAELCPAGREQVLALTNLEEA